MACWPHNRDLRKEKAPLRYTVIIETGTLAAILDSTGLSADDFRALL